ncbi:MAG: electron transport complex subunit RsxC [Bacteroidetes bacterium]|nr:electron transport complex subunit RsxC [Bacteroidota bacterium]
MKTFKRGGIHPKENKISSAYPIEVIPPPAIVYIPLSQHAGMPAIPVVNKNDKVKTGQLIAKAQGFISADIHSSVSGIVTNIQDIADAAGYLKKAIIIKTEGDEWLENIERGNTLVKNISLSQTEIIEKIKDSGIVGLGGAAFPTHIKLTPPKGKIAEILIINGAECEPYLTSDHRLMIEKGDEIMVGITILLKALNVEKAIIGIEANKQDAINILTSISEKYENIEVHTLKVKYPQGSEKQLIKALTGREVPSQKLPVDVGCVVQNIGTTFAVYEAVQKNKPLIERVVTVSGSSIKKPSNFLVRIGTPVSFLIEKAGGLPENTGKIISGGTMMGKSFLNIEMPVVKGMSGVTVLDEKETLRMKALNCIRCGKCVKVCPMGLAPYLLATISEHSGFEKAEKEKIMDCMECGSCSYICPSGRPLLDYIRVGKIKTGEIIRKRN